MPDFKIVSIACACLTSILFLSLLFVPDLIFWIFAVETTEAARFIARRASILFLGTAIISYMGRNAPDSTLRQGLVLGMFVLWGAMAVLGVFEFARAYAGPGILLAVAAETAFAFAYWSIWKRYS